MAGDLNFRISDVNTERVFVDITSCSKEGDYSPLLAKDELSLAIQNKQV